MSTLSKTNIDNVESSLCIVLITGKVLEISLIQINRIDDHLSWLPGKRIITERLN